MAEAQAALGHDVTIVTAKLGKEDYRRSNRVTLHAYPCEFSAWHWSKAMDRAMPSHIAGKDIVHIHTVWEFPTWRAAKQCRLLRVPYVIRPCGMLEEWSLSQRRTKKWLYLHSVGNSILRNAAAIHFTSDTEFVNSRLTCSRYDQFVIPIGLNPAKYENSLVGQDFYSLFPMMKGREVILYLGRLHYKKQPEVVIKAFEIASNRYPNAFLVLAGPGEPDYVAHLKQLTHQLGIEHKVLFTGMLNADAVREAYKASAMFVLPSLQENFGISLAEAMLSGLPVIVSNQVGLSSEISTAGAGVVCPPEVKSNADAMAKLLGDSQLRKSMGLRAKNLTMQRFTWEMLIKELIDVYADIIAGRQVSAAWRKSFSDK